MKDGIWVADFETTTEIDFKEEGCVRCYLWHARSLDDSQEALGYSAEEFVEFCGRKDVKTVWFFNVKFDGAYTLWQILENGWIPSPKQIRGKNTYSHIVTEQGQWMQLVLRFGNHVCKIQDAAKKFPGFNLEKVADIYGIEGKSNLPLIRRPPDYVVTDVEIDRVKGDTRILRVAMADLYARGHTKLTMASDAKADYKKRVGEKTYKRWFPWIGVEMDKFCRAAYRGGWVFVNPKYQSMDMEKVAVYDVNSMFPAQMRNKPLPWGRPFIRKEPKEGELYFVRFHASFKIKEGMFPTYQRKGSFRTNQSEFVRESNGIEEVTMTSVDYEEFKKRYDVMYEADHTYVCFQSKRGMFDDYIDYWMAEKERASDADDDAAKATAKRFLNSLYGKFGQNPVRESMMSELDPRGVIKWHTETGDIDDTSYVPVAAFITSYARQLISNSAQVFSDDFIYADTDSIHCKNAFEHQHLLDVHKSRLGAWKLESVSAQGRYVGPKKYIHKHEHPIGKGIEYEVIKCAGMNGKSKDEANWETFRKGAIFQGKIAGKFVPGGYLLYETTYTLGV